MIETGQRAGLSLDAARCECPSLDECPLFDDPGLPEKNREAYASMNW